MLILGIESSCDETAMAVVEDGVKVISSVIASQQEEHKLYGGVVPEIASRRHTQCITQIYKQALAKADKTISDIDGIAVTNGPGLIGALLTGVSFAKGLALATGKPLIPVNHIKGHIAANYITHPQLKPPFLCLVVSGGHSHIIEVLSYTEYSVIGRTRDDAAGEAFDKAARTLGFPYPGGVYMDQHAKKGNKDAYTLPTPKVTGSEYDFSFSGLKTAVINLVHNMEQKDEDFSTDDVAAVFTHKVVEILCDNTFLALRNKNYTKLCIAGGVSANSHLRKRLRELAAKQNIELFMPELELCGDNAAMIAAQGYYELLAGTRGGTDLNGFASLVL